MSHHNPRKLLPLAVCALLLLTSFGRQALSARAMDNPPPPPGPRRVAIITVQVDLYEWWLIRWSSNAVACQLFIDHEGLPTSLDIWNACGASIHEDWFDTQPCVEADAGGNVSNCQGVYLHLAGQSVASRQVEVDLPPPTAWLTLQGCTPEAPSNRCEGLPQLLVSGQELLPNESIVRVAGALDGVPFDCPGAACSLPLSPTGEQGVPVEFWATSSFGDESEHYSAMLRVIPWGSFMDPDDGAGEAVVYYVDVLSSQWRGTPPASCADVWEVFPPVGGPPGWLTTPSDPADLASNLSLYYLAGMLIRNGVVDASSCSDGGMTTDTLASECGVQVSAPQVEAWQNQFNTEIMDASAVTGVPAQLLKNIFARESQFWPGIFQDYMEAGLGQMTEYGADTVLLWNPTFFEQFCPLVLHASVCARGFEGLTADEQNLVRGALVRDVNAACPECVMGINLTQAGFSVRVFAETLLANCTQVGQVMQNIGASTALNTASYTDLWRYTLVNYNAGVGCLSDALEKTRENGMPLEWVNVSGNLEGVCAGAVDYVSDISREPAPSPTPTTWVRFSTPTPIPTPLPGGE